MRIKVPRKVGLKERVTRNQAIGNLEDAIRALKLAQKYENDETSIAYLESGHRLTKFAVGIIGASLQYARRGKGE